MKVKNSIRTLAKGAEKEFRNQLIYDPNSFRFSNFAFGQYNNAVDGAGAGAVNVSRLAPSEATLVLVITNTDAVAVPVTLFNVGGAATGATSSGLTPTFVAGVTVTCPQSSYGTVLISLLSKVYKIGGLKYSCKDKVQLSNNFTVGYTNERGRKESQVYTPRYLGNNMQNVDTQIDDPTFELDISVDSFITITVNGTTATPGGENVELVFTVAGIVEPTRGLIGSPALAINPVGFQSGIPAQSLVVSNASAANGINLQQKPIGNNAKMNGFY